MAHFGSLKQGDMEQIAAKHLSLLQKRVSSSGIQLQLPEELAAWVAGKLHGDGGARKIRTLVSEQVEGPLAMYLLKCNKKPSRIKARLTEDSLRFGGT